MPVRMIISQNQLSQIISKVKATTTLKDKEINSETLNVGGIEINREEYKIVGQY
jgi:hypothetical protein